MSKWIAHIDWQGKCKQRGASPGNNDFGDSSLSLPPPGRLERVRLGGSKREVGWRGPDGHLPAKVSSEVVGGEGRGRVATSWGRSRPGSPPRFPSRAGDAGRGRGRGYPPRALLRIKGENPCHKQNIVPTGDRDFVIVVNTLESWYLKFFDPQKGAHGLTDEA